MWSCASISPGIKVRPVTSTISAFAGQAVAARGPAAMIRSPSMTTAASGTGAAPVPSIKVAPVSTRIIYAWRDRKSSRGLPEWNGHRFYHRGDGWRAGRVSGAYPRATDSRRIGPGCRARHSGRAATGGNTMGLDLLIRNGTIVDGSGAARYQGDVGIRQGQIVEIGRIRAGAERVIDADGLMVAPGFVDGHTHMDAQVAWDRIGSCSCWHGVTTVIMGNCGFALAPCRPEEREWFARCLTAVEDIPTEAMLAGIDWTWESFPQYLATVDHLPKAINYGAYIGHSALRMFVMGKRALSEKATEDDLARMAEAVKEAIRAGAMGFSSSRATTHVTPDNTPVASRIADWSEVDRLVGAMAELNAGIFQVGPDTSGGEAQRRFLARLKQVAVETGRPVMFGTISSRQGDKPNPWTYQLEYLDDCAAAGARMWGQTTTRSINAIFSLKSYLPFDVLPAWRALRHLPLHEQKQRLADPATRRQLVAAEADMKPRGNVFQGGGAATTDPRKPDYDNLYAMKSVDWDDPTVAQLSAQRGKHPV